MKAMKRPTAQAGFTLIELLIVAVIFVLISSGAFLNYRKFTRRQQVIQSVANLQEALRLAQKKARVGEKPSGCVTLNGYKVTAATNTRTIRIYAACSDLDHQVTTAELVGNARMTVPLDVTFKVITGGVENAGAVRVGYWGNFEIYRFYVNSGGEITQGDYE
jgi:prepilin-type N-terminal cleavage/methylation domain-containing protein